MATAWNFTPLNKKLKFLWENKTQDYLAKWSMNGLSIACWAFDEPYQPHRIIDLLTALFQLSEAQQLLPWRKVISGTSKMQPVPWQQGAGDIGHIQPVPCSITSLELFDKVLDPCEGVVLSGTDGEVRGCFEDTIDGFIVSNLLQQMIINKDSEVFHIYTKEERRQFLFRIFGHLIVGGQLCQYEDYVQPYIDVATAIYKEVVNVQRSKESGLAEVRSKCFSVRSPGVESLQDFIYAFVDPGLREVTLLSNSL